MEWTLLLMHSTLPRAIEWTPPYPVLLSGLHPTPYSEQTVSHGVDPLHSTNYNIQLGAGCKQSYGMDSTERYFQKTAEKYGVDLTVENPLSQTSMEFAVQQATLQ
ncbi:hypothetical protein EMCRGX_G029175 [Ephydatia muelleri]